MNPPKKALELITSYLDLMPHLRIDKARECAIIAAKEARAGDWYIGTREDNVKWVEYWNDVIENIKVAKP